MMGMAGEQSQQRVVPPIPAPRLSLVQANSGKYYFTHISHLKTGLGKIARFSYTLSCLKDLNNNTYLLITLIRYNVVTPLFKDIVLF